jgi:hypothetical protein
MTFANGLAHATAQTWHAADGKAGAAVTAGSLQTAESLADRLNGTALGDLAPQTDMRDANGAEVQTAQGGSPISAPNLKLLFEEQHRSLLTIMSVSVQQHAAKQGRCTMRCALSRHALGVLKLRCTWQFLLQVSGCILPASGLRARREVLPRVPGVQGHHPVHRSGQERLHCAKDLPDAGASKSPPYNRVHAALKKQPGTTLRPRHARAHHVVLQRSTVACLQMRGA